MSQGMSLGHKHSSHKEQLASTEPSTSSHAQTQDAVRDTAGTSAESHPQSGSGAFNPWANEADKHTAIRGRGIVSCRSRDCLHGKLKEPRGKLIELVRMFSWASGSENNMFTDHSFLHIETVGEKIPLGTRSDYSSRSFTLQQGENTTG